MLVRMYAAGTVEQCNRIIVSLDCEHFASGAGEVRSGFREQPHIASDIPYHIALSYEQACAFKQLRIPLARWLKQVPHAPNFAADNQLTASVSDGQAAPDHERAQYDFGQSPQKAHTH
jgi:hypothetical protein